MFIILWTFQFSLSTIISSLHSFRACACLRSPSHRPCFWKALKDLTKRNCPGLGPCWLNNLYEDAMTSTRPSQSLPVKFLGNGQSTKKYRYVHFWLQNSGHESKLKYFDAFDNKNLGSHNCLMRQLSLVAGPPIPWPVAKTPF